MLAAADGRFFTLGAETARRAGFGSGPNVLDIDAEAAIVAVMATAGQRSSCRRHGRGFDGDDRRAAGETRKGRRW